MAQPHIFVSYSRKDTVFTQRLVGDLRAAGAAVWMDVQSVMAGNFVRAIEAALSQCEWLVLVLSPDAIASDYVLEETYTALHRVKQGYMRGVIPILAAPCAPGTIPPQLDVLQRYDATRDYDGALTGLLRAVGLESVAASVPPLAPMKVRDLELAQLIEDLRRAGATAGAERLLSAAERAGELTPDEMYRLIDRDRVESELRDRLQHPTRSLARVRSVLLIMPVLLAIFSVAMAVDLYGRYVEAHPASAGESFLLLWEQGFRQSTYLTLSTVLLTEVLLVSVIVAVTPYEHYVRTMADRMCRNMTSLMTRVLDRMILSTMR